jgi:cobalt-zinc-cadmium efflux system membrane fusion protein
MNGQTSGGSWLLPRAHGNGSAALHAILVSSPPGACLRRASGQAARLLATLTAVVVSFALAGCSAPGDAQPARSADSQSATFFTVPAEQLAQLQVVRAQKEPWTIDVHATGTVDWNADRTSQAITQVSGPITRIVADLGTHVKAGDPLLYVASPDLAAAISAYRKASNRLGLAREALNRNRDLLEHHAIAQRDFEASQADYNDALTEVQDNGEALRILGMNDAQIADAQQQDATIRPEFAVRSPVSGLVVQRLVLPGQLVQAGVTECFVISDTTTMWVQAHLYEPDLASVRVGSSAEVAAGTSTQPFEGRVSYIDAVLDPATRTTSVRVVTANPHDLLKKDAFVNVLIHGASSREMVTIPSSAILYNSDNFPFVYVQVKPGQFAERLVTPGPGRDDRVAIVSGLEAGDEVVAQGSVFLQFAQMYQR